MLFDRFALLSGFGTHLEHSKVLIPHPLVPDGKRVCVWVQGTLNKPTRYASYAKKMKC